MDGEFGLQIGDNRVVQGVVKSDRDSNGRVPIVIIDGREVTWDEVGRTLMSFEGWQFKLNLADKSEEIWAEHYRGRRRELRLMDCFHRQPWLVRDDPQ